MALMDEYSANCLCQAEKIDSLENDYYKMKYKNLLLIKLLDEATQLLFIKADTPSRELFRWYKENQRNQRNQLKETR